jgi:3',5'-cyclic AMP phosphodiesterase CpdA
MEVNMLEKPISRKQFLKLGATTVAAGALAPYTGFVDILKGAEKKVSPFRFVVVGDTHLYDIPNHRFDLTFKRAVDEIKQMKPKPDFVVFLGDLAQFGKKTELEKGYKLLQEMGVPYKIIPGEHDWYLDMGETWKKMFGNPYWHFEHKGVHFIGMNSILVRDYWTAKKMSPEERMNAIAELECHICGLWGVREEQLDWLKKEVKSLEPDTPIIIFTHSPLWDYYPRWNFQTEDAPEIRKIMSKFEKVISIHGHVHQIVYNKFDNFVSIGNLATAWPWPYPPVKLPYPEIRMFRGDPGDKFDVVGYMNLNLDTKGNQIKPIAKYSEWATFLPDKVKKGVEL